MESRDDTRLSKVPSGFQAALVALFDVEEVQSFALVEGDDRAALEAREAGLVIITSNDQEPWTAHVLVVSFDNVEVEVQYHDPRPGLGWGGQPIPPTNVTVRGPGEIYNLTVRENMEPRSLGVKALIKAKVPLRCSAPGGSRREGAARERGPAA